MECLRKYGNEMPDHVGHDLMSLSARGHVITGLTGNLLLIKCSSNVNRASNAYRSIGMIIP